VRFELAGKSFGQGDIHEGIQRTIGD